MELQQTPVYLSYLAKLGWHVEHIDRIAYVWRKIPLAGAIAKIQRPDTLPDQTTLIRQLRAHHVRTVAIEPSDKVPQSVLTSYADSLRNAGLRINGSAFLTTKTITVDLKPDVETIFSRFTEAKRRAVRKAQKNHVFVIETTNIPEVIRTKNRSAGLFGFITTYGVKELWQTLGDKKIAGVLAYEKKSPAHPLGCILLVFHGNVAYYWIAGSTRHGKKLFTPTLLVFEAMQIAKRHNAESFDFLGVWDERLPKQNNEWKGFTKFKEGFGGSVMYYPLSSVHLK